MGCQIFISYRRKGGDEFAEKLNKSLREIGYSDEDVFYDFETLKKSTNFPAEIEEGIKSCTDYILVLSPGALDGCHDKEDWVRKEIELAMKYDKNIVPVMKDGFNFPADLPEKIASIKDHTALAFPPDFFDEAFQRMVIVRLKAKLDISIEYEERIQTAAKGGDVTMINEFALREEMGTVKTAEDPVKAFKDYAGISDSLPAACYNIADIYDKCSVDTALASKYKIENSVGENFEEYLLSEVPFW